MPTTRCFWSSIARPSAGVLVGGGVEVGETPLGTPPHREPMRRADRRWARWCCMALSTTAMFSERPRRGLCHQAFPAGPPAGAKSRDRGLRFLRSGGAAGRDHQRHPPSDCRGARGAGTDRDLALSCRASGVVAPDIAAPRSDDICGGRFEIRNEIDQLFCTVSAAARVSNRCCRFRL